ncbi:transketolase, partial [candidate division KSB3 bacterium]|nr:transketolase [candidate division KSB3 bacterium]MBD3324886.1 transketolase [candidate division KSB3 bacterium]
TGNMLPIAFQTAEELRTKGLSTKVVSLHTVKPLDCELLSQIFSQVRLVVTLEEHSILGGMGASVAEWVTEQPFQRAGLCRIGTPDTFLHEAGGQEYARKGVQLTAPQIAQRILKELDVRKPL